MNLTRRAFFKRSLRYATVAGIGGLAYPTLIEPRRIEIQHVRLTIPGLPRAFDGLTIAHLTDFHRSRFVSESYLQSAVEATNALQPDLTVFTGDYLTHGRTIKGEFIYGEAGNADEYAADCARCLGKARARYGVFASLGNHDAWFDADRMTTLIQLEGIPVLRNTATTVSINGEPLPVVGLGDLWTEGVNFPKAFAGLTAPFALVLMHNPDPFEHWPRPGAHLILAGHTHGGQVNIPFFGSPVVPSQYGRKYAQGLFRRDDSFLYVNRGLGVIYPPVRFNCRPEIAILHMSCA